MTDDPKPCPVCHYGQCQHDPGPYRKRLTDVHPLFAGSYGRTRRDLTVIGQPD